MLKAKIIHHQTYTAYLVADTLSVKAGKGTGIDLLVDVERVEFKDGDTDLGLRIERMDWDGNKNNGYDHVMVHGTKGDDIIKDWGDGLKYSDGSSSLLHPTSDDVKANNEIFGKGGNDIIFGYAGGDRISGGEGNDFIDGGADGTADQFGYAPKDDAIYFGKSRTMKLQPIKPVMRLS